MFKFILIFLYLSVFAQISEEEFKKSFKRPDEELLKRIKQAITVPILTEDFAKIYADNISYVISEDKIEASGGATVIYKDAVVQSEKLVYNKKSGDLVVSGGVKVFRGASVIEADDVEINVFSGKGTFRNGKAFFIDSFFSFSSKSGDFVQTSEFNLKDSLFSSCRCKDGSLPWSFTASKCDIIRQDSLKAKHVFFRVFDFPVLYAPYLWLPLEESRKAGFLTPKLGTSRRHGFSGEFPYFLPLTYNSELTLTPFIYQKTRVGLKGKGAYLLKDGGSVKGAFYYSNEGPRKKNNRFERRGLNPELFTDPRIDTNRFGGALNVYTKLLNDPKSYALDLVADIKRTSDDLLIKETKNDIARHSAPFLISHSNLRLRTDKFGSFVLRGESVQDFGRYKDRIFDEAPSVSHVYTRSLPIVNFGVTSLSTSFRSDANFTNYIREEGYEGQRGLIRPSIRLKAPLSYLGLFDLNSSVGAKFYSAKNSDRDFEDFLLTNRIEATLSTKIEKNFKFFEEIFKGEEIKKSRQLKHSIEPFFGHIFQENNESLDNIPNFNPVIDRQRNINAIKYGLKTSLKEFSQPEVYIDPDFPEIVPDLYDYLSEFENLRDFVREDLFSSDLRKRDLVSFEISELYSLEEEFGNLGSKFSNTSIKGTVNPMDNLSLRFRGGFDRDDSRIKFARIGSKSSFGEASLYFDYIFKNVQDLPDTSEVIAGARWDVTERLSVGGWIRYDLESSELYDSFSVVQFSGRCKCWFLDVGLEKQKNPDDIKLSLTVVLSGIGDMVQDLPVKLSDDNT
ncbi:MAG: hypothetical protein N2654_07465 [Deltaproteobacteria bacterium]|nr:hypothetical protein [Deltaproteobacteria bacterium]